MRFGQRVTTTLVAAAAMLLIAGPALAHSCANNSKQGGAGSAVNEFILSRHEAIPVLNIGLPDRFIEHGGREELLEEIGLDGQGILRRIQKRLRAKDVDQASSVQKLS